MKNLFIVTALVATLLGSTAVFAGEITSENNQLSAFEDVQSVSASDEELKVAGKAVGRSNNISVGSAKKMPLSVPYRPGVPGTSFFWCSEYTAMYY